MSRIAKPLIRLPLNATGFLGRAVRENMVYLTMVVVIGSGWIMAWCKSVDMSERQLVFPALRKDEIARFEQGHDRTGDRRGLVTQNSELTSTMNENDNEAAE